MSISTKNIRKFLYFILFGLVTTILVTVCSYSIKEQITTMNTWQYNARYDFEIKLETNEDGEDGLVMYVSTPEQFAGAINILNMQIPNNKVLKKENVLLSSISHFPNASLKLTSNLDFSNGGWSQEDLNNNAEIDGQGYVISNVNIYSDDPAGLVGTNNGSIKNLVISNISVSSSSSWADIGGVAGRNSGTIENVSIVGSSYINGRNYYTGGIAGNNSGKIEKCINYARVKDGNEVGGIAGDNTGKIINCFNHGEVYDTDSSGVYVGGIAGYNSKSIYLCENTGNVKASTSTKGSSTSYCGGIVGYTTTNINKCGNTGKVECGRSSYIEKTYAGGIAGYLSNGADVTNSYNRGEITGDAKYYTKDKSSDIKGIHKFYKQVGSGDYYWKYYVRDLDEDCSGSGYYKGQGTSSTYSESGEKCYLGGIAGWGTSGSRFDNCYNSGYVKDTNSIIKEDMDLYVKLRAYNYDHYWFFGWHTDTKNEYLYKINTEVHYQKDILFSPICPTRGLGYNNCFNTNTSIDEYHEMTFKTKRWLETEGDTKQFKSFSGWDKSDKDEWFYGVYGWWNWPNIYSENVCNTEFGVDAKSVSSIKIYARYNGVKEYDYVTYVEIDTGLPYHGSKLYVQNCNDYIKKDSLSSSGIWAKDSKINGGYPYIKEMYYKK